MSPKVTKFLISLVAFFWAYFIISEYFLQHSKYYYSLKGQQHYDYLAAILLVTGGLSYMASRFRNVSFVRRMFSGWGMLLVFLLFCLIAVGFYLPQSGLDGDGSLLFLTGRLLTVIGAVYGILALSYGIGKPVLKRLNFPVPARSGRVFAVGGGIVLLVFLLMLLGAFFLLRTYILFPLFLVILILSRTYVLDFVKKTLIRPFKPGSSLNAFGISAFLLLLVFLSLNLLSITRPFPMGWDAMSLYINLSSLIDDYHGLVQGHAAYNWSIFMSLGYLLFDDTAIVLALSLVGGVLSLAALHVLFRRYLDENWSLFGLAVLYAMPLMGWLSFQDMKVDFGFLFYGLLLALLLDPNNDVKTKTKGRTRNRSRKKQDAEKSFSWLKAPKVRKSMKWPVSLAPYRHLIYAGILAGFAFGIKYTGFLLVLAVLGSIFYHYGGRKGLIAYFLLAMSGVLLLNLDAQSGLADYHLGRDYLKWIFLIMGVGWLAIAGVRFKMPVLKIGKAASVFLLCFALTFVPWLTKNYLETGAINRAALLEGKKATPSFRFIDLATGNDKTDTAAEEQGDDPREAPKNNE